MIDLYCNQTFTLKRKGSVNEYNEPSYSSYSIKGRFEYNNRIIRNNLGETLNSEATIYTTSEVKADDILVYNDISWVVKRVDQMVGLSGDIEFYEVRL